MSARSALQRGDVRIAAAVICPSHSFAEHLERDYRVGPARLHVVPNPIDVDCFVPRERSARDQNLPIRLLFASRISVRKGVEMITSLSHRLTDLAGRVMIDVVGGHTLWSDYRPLLRDLEPSTARVLGPIAPASMPSVYATADALLQPSHYEPFGLTVGEALASGLPVVVSDEVGAREGVSPEVCRVFHRGDIDALELAVRDLVRDLQNGQAQRLSDAASSEARRLWALRVVSRQVRAALAAAIAG